MKEIIDRSVAACGTLSKLAEAMGQSVQTVSNWRERGVPVPQCAELEEATRYAVRRWEMRPKDWHRIWPELVGQKGAPKVKAEKAGVA